MLDLQIVKGAAHRHGAFTLEYWLLLAIVKKIDTSISLFYISKVNL